MEPSTDSCPSCRYLLFERTAYCPHCGFQLTHPVWKKAGAWVLLIVIGYGLVRCQLRMMEGFNPANTSLTESEAGQPAAH